MYIDGDGLESSADVDGADSVESTTKVKVAENPGFETVEWTEKAVDGMDVDSVPDLQSTMEGDDSLIMKLASSGNADGGVGRKRKRSSMGGALLQNIVYSDEEDDLAQIPAADDDEEGSVYESEGGDHDEDDDEGCRPPGRPPGRFKGRGGSKASSTAKSGRPARRRSGAGVVSYKTDDEDDGDWDTPSHDSKVASCPVALEEMLPQPENPLSMEGWEVGDENAPWYCKLKYGDRIEFFSREESIWYCARIIAYMQFNNSAKTYIGIHYDGYSKKFDIHLDLRDPMNERIIRPWSGFGKNTKAFKLDTLGANKVTREMIAEGKMVKINKPTPKGLK
ncbi:hypothetical protein BC829DRAFT_380865 [Chytridium lagenaria]|nr:hypothetical protein BC829DRAFT_380865 [Chytridium lagenaria]